MSSAAALFLPFLFAQTTIVATPQAPQPFPASQEASEGTGRIEGVITRSGTGEPIAGAAVHLARVTEGNRPNALAVFRPDDLALSATTDIGGRFAIADVTPGQYRIAGFRNGFVRTEYGQRSAGAPGAPVELVAGRTLDASFEMIPASVIGGRVHDASGEPVPYVQVFAMRPRVLPDGRKILHGVQSATTDDRGRYRLFWLNPGEYVISAHKAVDGLAAQIPLGVRGASVITSNTPPPVEDMAAFHPGVPDQALATPVRVGAGEEHVDIDVWLAARATFTVSGRVVSPVATSSSAFMTIEPHELILLDGAPVSIRSRVTDAEGNFTLENVPPGTYRVRAWAQRPGGASVRGSIPIEVTNRDVENLALTLAPGADVNGSISIEDAATASASESAADFDWTDVRVTLRGDDAAGADVTESGEAQADFRIEDVPPGEYTVSVNMASPSLYVKRIMLGSTEAAPGETITIAPGFTGPLDVLLSPNGGRIQGVASTADGEPVPNAAVTLLPLDVSDMASAGLELPRRHQTRTDPGGRYALSGIAPGEYRVFSWDDLERVPFLDEEFVRAYSARGERVVVREGDAITRDLEVVPESDIR